MFWILKTLESGVWCFWSCWLAEVVVQNIRGQWQIILVWSELASLPQWKPSLHPAPCWLSIYPEIMFLWGGRKKWSTACCLAANSVFFCAADAVWRQPCPALSCDTVTVPEDPSGPAQVGLCCTSCNLSCLSCAAGSPLQGSVWLDELCVLQ